MEESIRTSIQKNPEILSDALFPIIGAAVRKAVGAALDGMMQSVNQVIEQSVSWHSLQWRWEALRTGKSFGEIVLVRSLLYRVEQVFLIHKKTGLLLQQRVADSVVIKDADLVSGMLTAIQDFVRDSFGAQPDQDLETLRVGDFDVWIQYGPHAILAAVIRGTPPTQLHGVFANVLEQICLKKGSEIERFTGDTSPFVSCQEDLKACFLGEGSPKAEGGSLLGRLIAAAALTAAAVWIFSMVRDNRRWNGYLDRVRAQPGVVVTAVEEHGGKHFVGGLRDPMAKDPAELLAGTGIDASSVRFRWEPYHSLQPAFEAARRLANETQWVEGRIFHFQADTAEIPVDELNAVDETARHMLLLVDAASQLSKSVRIEIIGHTDIYGDLDHNRRLAASRAEELRAAITSAGVPAGLIVTRGVATFDPLRPENTLKDQPFNRGVSFRVILTPK